MFEDDFRKSDEARKRRRHMSLILLSAILLAVLGGGGLLAWQLFAGQSPSTNGNAYILPPQTTQVNGTDPQSKATPSDVAAEVRQNVAQKLQLSVTQLQAQLQAGTSIGLLATQHGMNPEQWHTFVLNTYQAAFDHAVKQGKMTQQLDDKWMHNIKSYPPGPLNDWVTMDCLGNLRAFSLLHA